VSHASSRLLLVADRHAAEQSHGQQSSNNTLFYFVEESAWHVCIAARSAPPRSTINTVSAPPSCSVTLQPLLNHYLKSCALVDLAVLSAPTKECFQHAAVKQALCPKSRQRPETATRIKTHALMQTLTCVFAVVMHQLLFVLLVPLWMALRGLNGGVLPDVLEPPLQVLHLRRKLQTPIVIQNRL
jgi:hypothetical protein